MQHNQDDTSKPQQRENIHPSKNQVFNMTLNKMFPGIRKHQQSTQNITKLNQDPF